MLSSMLFPGDSCIGSELAALLWFLLWLYFCVCSGKKCIGDCISFWSPFLLLVPASPPPGSSTPGEVSDLPQSDHAIATIPVPDDLAFWWPEAFITAFSTCLSNRRTLSNFRNTHAWTLLQVNGCLALFRHWAWSMPSDLCMGTTGESSPSWCLRARPLFFADPFTVACPSCLSPPLNCDLVWLLCSVVTSQV